MIIKINANVIANHLAIDDILNNYNVTREQAIKLIDTQIEDNRISMLQDYYQSKYDYYFEILTNSAL